jgi:hypothetical protein
VTKIQADILWSIIVPLTAFLLNWKWRSRENYAQSAAADFVLAIAAFDFGALPAYEFFKKVFTDPLYQGNPTMVFGTLFLITLTAWFLIFVPYEAKLSSLYISHNDVAAVRRSGKFPYYFFIPWFLVLAVMAPHIYVFLKG